MAEGGKRKRNALTLETKLSILDKLLEGASQSRLTSEYGVGKSTITDLKKNESKLHEFVSTAESQGVSSSRKIMRLAKDEKLEEALYIWFVQKRSQGTPVSGPLLCEKATQFHEQMHREEAGVVPFKASGEWLWRFC